MHHKYCYKSLDSTYEYLLVYIKQIKVAPVNIISLYIEYLNIISISFVTMLIPEQKFAFLYPYWYKKQLKVSVTISCIKPVSVTNQIDFRRQK